MTVIKDGTGESFLAKVDNTNSLHTAARTFSLAVYASAAKGQTFSIFGTTTIAAGVEKTGIILINNPTSKETIGILSVLSAIQGEAGRPVTFRSYLGKSTYTGGGTVITPVNSNTGSLNTLDVTAVADNPVLGGTDTLISQSFQEATSGGFFQIEGRLVLAPTGSFRLTVTGDPAASGTRISAITIEYFVIDTTSIS